MSRGSKGVINQPSGVRQNHDLWDKLQLLLLRVFLLLFFITILPSSFILSFLFGIYLLFVLCSVLSLSLSLSSPFECGINS